MNHTTINPKANQNRRRFITVSNNTIAVPDCHFTSRATLLALGIKMEQLKIMETIGRYVTIAQKTVKDSPLEKLTDALITILAGGRGLVEANKRVRADRALQRAFGRERCAEQSVISETFNACTGENVQQMSQALTELYRQHSGGYHHDYQQQWQLLDIDLSGQPCGPKAAFASKGYFAHQRNRRGRQLGRVWATWYQEIVVDQIYPGNTTLHSVLPDLLKQAEQVLALDLSRRARTILRIDGHGGSLNQVNDLLSQGYQVHTKEGNWRRAQQLAASVKTWYDDPQVPGRQVGWVTLPATEYVRPVYRIAVRTHKKNGQWGIGIVLSTLSAPVVSALAGLLPEQMAQPLTQMFAYVYFYDLRAGGIEIGLKQDKQGLGITKRNKQSFEAQQMLTHLNALAHNLLIWFQQWLAHRWSAVTQFGLLRFIRDVLHISGGVFFRRQPAGNHARP
jgi:hypothetical protein